MDLPAYRESSLSAKRLEGLSLRLASLSLRRQRVGPGRGYSPVLVTGWVRSGKLACRRVFLPRSKPPLLSHETLTESVSLSLSLDSNLSQSLNMLLDGRSTCYINSYLL